MNRRIFLQLTGTTTSGLLLIPTFLNASPFLRGNKRGENILVFVQLNGGNDGLNTFIPYENARYYDLRPTIGIKKQDVINKTAGVGFHPALVGMSQIAQNGHLSVVQNVGYPNPNRSHFRSQEIWETASDSHEFISHGWLGRFLDIQCASDDLLGAVNINQTDSLALRSNEIHSLTVKDFNRYKQQNSESQKLILSDNPQLDFVRKVAYASAEGREEIQHALAKAGEKIQYEGGNLGKNLKWIAQLIKGGLNSKVYYTSLNGFDTHKQQLNLHQQQLKQLDGAISSFYNDIKAAGLLDRVTMVVFSEFGRRVAENGTGTDHGTAGPMIIIGGNNQNQFLGGMPNLTDLDNGDLKHQVDFRSVYAALLQHKFGFNPKEIGIQQDVLNGLF